MPRPRGRGAGISAPLGSWRAGCRMAFRPGWHTPHSE
jgi:hypothetical protein